MRAVDEVARWPSSQLELAAANREHARAVEGGVERWIVYPVVLWMVILGSGLAVRASH